MRVNHLPWHLTNYTYHQVQRGEQTTWLSLPDNHFSVTWSFIRIIYFYLLFAPDITSPVQPFQIKRKTPHTCSPWHEGNKSLYPDYPLFEVVGSLDCNSQWNPMTLCQFSFTCIEKYFGSRSVLRKLPRWRISWVSWSRVAATFTSTAALWSITVSLKCKRCKPSLQGWNSAWLTIRDQTCHIKGRGFKS